MRMKRFFFFYLKACACYICFFHQVIALKYLWKILFISSKKVFRYQILFFLCYVTKSLNTRHIVFHKVKTKFHSYNFTYQGLLWNAREISNKHQIFFLFEYETYDVKQILSVIHSWILNYKIKIILNGRGY